MNPTEVYKLLVNGIESLDFHGENIPCELIVIGENAFPVLLTSGKQIVIAASQYFTGRIVVISHEAFLNNPTWASFLQNVVKWLKPSPNALVGIHNSFDYLLDSLSNTGTSVQSSTQFSDSFGVYCTHAYDDEQASDLIQSLKNGKGLLIAGQCVQWSTENGGQDVLLNFPGNKVTSVAGIYFNNLDAEQNILSISTEMPICPIYFMHQKDIEADINHLLNGVTELNLEKEEPPSSLLVHGSLAFSLVMDEFMRTKLAAAYYGRGRVVVATNDHHINDPEMKQFILNAVSWLDDGRQGNIAIDVHLKNLHDILSEENVACELSNFNASASVYCCTTYTDKDADKIHKFVAEGKGLLIAGKAWVWAFQNKDKNVLVEFPGNKILNRFGITILGTAAASKMYKALNSEKFSKHYSLRKALFELHHAFHFNKGVDIASSWYETFVRDCQFLKDIPLSASQVFSPIQRWLVQLFQSYGFRPVSREHKVRKNSKEFFLLKLLAVVQHLVSDLETWIKQVMADYLELPIEPPVTLTVNATNTESTAWRSTCLYIAQARTVTITFPSAAINMGLEVQIGCQTDNLSDKDVLERPLDAVKIYQVNKPVVSACNVWGGLLYIRVPGGRNLGKLTLRVEGASLAPFFRHGKTDTALWLSTLRFLPAPWAELASENIILTVPSTCIRNLEDPEALMSLWAEIMVSLSELAIKPIPYSRPERIVLDVQIIAGSLHSGYPIMAYDNFCSAMLNRTNLLKFGIWGAIHELGHNVDNGGWTLSGHTEEATCNLWTVYVHEKALGIPRDVAHMTLKSENRSRIIRQYLDSGPNLRNWHGGICLETYLQLQEGFGWEPFLQLFAEYRRLGHINQDNKYRMNLWNEMFSKAVGKNLTAFFKMWGWPIDDSRSLAEFPDWEENPMKKYVTQ
ncbi:TRPM8 channel-associated factor homolog isoform X2 [Rhinatrema bivittatum]|nr:TRPM8 channel-associated factor homolog isoform X2 [Rhinatrema bivittatum]XP_029463161.1 TRPM8 channel-associated factor homolog isoform X2 [Rhinatrema bivittatum]